MNRVRIAMLFFILAAFTTCTSENELKIRINASTDGFDNTPVFLDINNALIKVSDQYCFEYNGQNIALQRQELSPSHSRLWWVANIPAGQEAVYTLSYDCPAPGPEFIWERVGSESIKLSRAGKPMIQYEHPVFDINNREMTYKPFHHVFDPETGKLITKGSGGLYSHHRGIFYGYNQIRINQGEPIDIWHNHDGEHSEHVEIVEDFSGPVLGGQTLRIAWRDSTATPFATETRTIRVFYENSQMIIDFHSLLMSTGNDTIELGGDRHHAGVQFRAANAVSENPESTFYIRPTSVSHLSSTQEIEGTEMTGLPWNAMSYFLDGKQYTIAYLSHPSNPNSAEMSERQYGRFGEFFPYTITPERPLEVKYRFIITQGLAPNVETLQKQFDNYVKSIRAEIIQ